MSKIFKNLGDRERARANHLYQRHYDNNLYRMAVTDTHTNPHRPTETEVERAGQLINAALAICGHPDYTLGYNTEWTDAEAAFLRKFEKRAFGQCQFVDENGQRCTEHAGQTAAAYGTGKVGFYCTEHAIDVANSANPERIGNCPRCGCLFGIM